MRVRGPSSIGGFLAACLLVACAGGSPDGADGDRGGPASASAGAGSTGPARARDLPTARPSNEAARLHAGLNLPPTQGSSNAGAFLDGAYAFDYSEAFLERLASFGFDALRLAVSEASAFDVGYLEALERALATVDGRGILCFFDTVRDGEGSHGDGRPNDLERLTAAWSALHERFEGYPDLRYELFNEPFGYPRTSAGAADYLRHMEHVIAGADLPRERVVLDGIGYASDVRRVAAAGWDGLLGYHFYPMWLPEGRRTQSAFSNLVQAELRGLSSRVLVTEFGARLDLGDSYRSYHANGDVSANQNALRGLHDALLALAAEGAPVLGTYLWHGWPNGDSYDPWQAEHRHGAAKVAAIQRDATAPRR
ncbi:hypothetical protein Pla163_11720 [Planctomycetes bacterium Pla163]|uniref:Cellulase (Glycosyl hydrolase family 5) n=1 Tax=Rohdeia mirabilis TaxID=2528008 RepID=A0A518CXX9_9BACT|nr:hypothetical protein Pla163_11720 [Planctomycetes bacterium Pla163]